MPDDIDLVESLEEVDFDDTRPEMSVPHEALSERFAEVAELANGEHGPVAITKGAETVGYLVGTQDVQYLKDKWLEEFLEERMKSTGPLRTTEEVMAGADAIIAAAARRRAKPA